MRWIGYFLHTMLALGLVLAYLAPVLDPRGFWLFGLLWLATRKWKGLALALLLFVPAIPVLPKYVQTAAGRADAATETPAQESLRVLSWNVRIFNKNVPESRFAGRDEMLDALRQQDADIVCLQEYFSVAGSRTEDHNRRMAEQVGLEHQAVWEAIVDRQGRMWGLGIFSRYPIVRKGTIPFPEHVLNGCHWADIQAPGGIVRVFNLHLQSIHLSHEAYSAESAIEDMRDSGARNVLLRKFLRAYRSRADQADRVAEAIAESPYPVLLCGDFNDPPQSYAYRTARGRLQDAFAEAGRGLARSHATLPGVRIDYILPDTGWTVRAYRHIALPISDHYPILAELQR
jgi:endonuclease/exonuclease/phosphatase family metal-dependent hydrolase